LLAETRYKCVGVADEDQFRASAAEHRIAPQLIEHFGERGGFAVKVGTLPLASHLPRDLGKFLQLQEGVVPDEGVNGLRHIRLL
jgi:hypothetical protein